MLLYARVLVFLVFVKKDEIKLTCPKDIGTKGQINMLLFKKEYFLKTKNSSGKGVRYEKTKKWVKLEVGEGLIMELCKYMTYRYP